MNVNDKILDAIELLANNSVQKAGYDKTIQAQILSCEDQVVGKYRCKYQDAIFYAYTNNPDIKLSKGTLVYILVPGNDMRQQKTIIGMVDKLGADYISTAVGDQAYHIIGANCVLSDNVYYLNTNNINYSYDLYNVNRVDNNIDLDIQGLNQYLKQSSSLIVGAKIRTEIPTQRQSYGHYGIIFNLEFVDENNPNGNFILRSYIINEDNMVDNPYNLLYDTRQYAIYDIDGINFKRIHSITIFNSDFPNASGNITTGLLNTGDIILSTFEIKGAVRMTEEQLNGISISFITPQGTFFMPNDLSSESKQITAQIRVKSRVVPPSQGIEFYWGVEDVSILSDSVNYNKNLGRGWKCINSFNVIANIDESADPPVPQIIQWTPMGDTYTITKAEATAYDNRIKVAAVYDGNVVTKQINIQNLSIDADFITITSSLGEKFFYGVGSTNLICHIQDSEHEYNNLSYSWAWENNGGLLQPITGGNDFIQGIIIDDNGDSCLTNVQVRKIYNFATFKCSVYSGNVYLGTGSIMLTNSMQGEGVNPLVINNGSALYKYSTTGVSPTSKSLDKPQQIQALTFVLYDDAGNQKITSDNFINQGLIQFPATVVWKIPRNNTLLKPAVTPSQQQEESQSQYYQFVNQATFSYEIADRYDINKTNNQIILQITYEGITARAETNFTFTKEGNIGTNGTEFTVKLVPNTIMANPPELPMITKLGSGNNYVLNYAIESGQDEQTIYIGNEYKYKFLKLQVWKSDQLVYDNLAQTNLMQPSAIEWSILQNHYYTYSDGSNSISVDDDSDFEVFDAEDGQFIYKQHSFNSYIAPVRANIIKCAVTFDNKIYYGAIPFITAYVNNSNDRIIFDEMTGFYSVMYGPDGLSPQYSNTYPFKFKNNNSNDYINVIRAAAISSIKYKDNQGPTELFISNLTQRNDDVAKFTPISKYNGECVNNSIRFETSIGGISIPIYFFLNRFGLANINEWDGNSVQINEKDGYILAPQVGAGQKDNNNRFTGVLMGQVKDPSKNQTQEGLFGYGKGRRTFFINSDNGAAIFGGGDGQIIIDPGNPDATGFDEKTKAMFYSSNFWTDYNSQTGLPTSYSSSNEAGAGMLIDLTSPRISFGNGNFTVDSSGNVILTGNLRAGKITGTNYYNFEVNNSATGTDDLLKAGHVPNSNNYNFVVKANGDVAMAGAITAKSGYIGQGSRKWVIGGNSSDAYIYSNRSVFDVTSGTTGLYIGTDGISAGNGTKRTFSVSRTGDVYIEGSIVMGEGSSISWDNIDNTTYPDLALISQSDGVYTMTNINNSGKQTTIPVLPTYIKSTYIDKTTIESPNIYGGQFYATGKGDQSSSIENDRPAYYISAGGYTSGGRFYPNDPIGYIAYDSNSSQGSGQWVQASDRVLFTTKKVSNGRQTAMKLRASGEMSFETGYDMDSAYVNNTKIYFMNGVQFNSIIKLTESRVTTSSDGWIYYIGAYGSSTPPTFAASMPYGPEIGQLFFKLE